jgi:hypothetical protein
VTQSTGLAIGRDFRYLSYERGCLPATILGGQQVVRHGGLHSTARRAYAVVSPAILSVAIAPFHEETGRTGLTRPLTRKAGGRSRPQRMARSKPGTWRPAA